MDSLGHAIKKFGMKGLDCFHLPDAASVSRYIKGSKLHVALPNLLVDMERESQVVQDKLYKGLL